MWLCSGTEVSITIFLLYNAKKYLILQKESIDLALQLLDGSEFRPGYKVTVEQAKFELKGEFDPKKRKKISAKAKKKAKERQEK